MDEVRKMMAAAMEQLKQSEKSSEKFGRREKERLRQDASRADAERAQQLREMEEDESRRKENDERLKKAHEDVLREQDERWAEQNDERQKIFESVFQSKEEEFMNAREEYASKERQYEEYREHAREQRRFAREQDARAFREYCEHLRAQFDKFMDMMRQKEWNRKVEKKWAERLDGLRKWFDPIRESFAVLRFSIDSFDDDDDAVEKAHIEVKVSVVMEKLDLLKDVMDNEIDDMQRMAQEHPNAEFLADIEESAKQVKQSSFVMSESLQLFKGDCNGFGDEWNSSKDAYGNLEKTVHLIPTVESLKEKYQNGF